LTRAIYAELSKEQFAQANAIWRELKPTYGDEVALRRAKARWAEVRNNVTGSHVGSVGNLTVSSPNPGMPDPGAPRPPPGQKQGVHSVATSTAELVGSNSASGATAYRQLRESDNPYDPKFDRSSFGTTLVGPPTAVNAGKPKEPPTDKADQTKPDPSKPDPTKHDQY
jgi:hypothetical protein